MCEWKCDCHCVLAAKADVHHRQRWTNVTTLGVEKVRRSNLDNGLYSSAQNSLALNKIVILTVLASTQLAPPEPPALGKINQRTELL